MNGYVIFSPLKYNLLMRFFDELSKLEYLDYLIRIGGTGPMRQLAEKLAVCQRTAERMLQYLREEGFPIEYDSVRNTYYYTKPVSIQIAITVGDQTIVRVSAL